MNKKTNTKLGKEIMTLLEKRNSHGDLSIFFNDSMFKFNFKSEKWEETKSKKGSDYTEYANDDTITMTFEGQLYNVINYGENTKLLEEFENIFKKYGLYYELGNSWNLSAYEI